MIANVSITINVTKQNRRISFSLLSYYQNMKRIRYGFRPALLTRGRGGIIGAEQIDAGELLIDGHSAVVAAGFAGDGGAATGAQLNAPFGVAVDAGGNLYIAEFSNNRVRKVGTNGNIRTLAGDGV